MPTSYGEKAAVYLVTVPADWKPQRPWDYPPTFEGGELYVKNVSGTQAAGAAFAFNKKAIGDSMKDRRWAIAARWVRQKWRPGTRDNYAAMREANAARAELAAANVTPNAAGQEGGAQ